jgi:hypothetical protein
VEDAQLIAAVNEALERDEAVRMPDS